MRACFENISAGLAAGRGDWLRCSPVTDLSRICRRFYDQEAVLFVQFNFAQKSKATLYRQAP